MNTDTELEAALDAARVEYMDAIDAIDAARNAYYAARAAFYAPYCAEVLP